VPQDQYQAALDYLFSATDYEKMRRVRYNADTFSLDRVRRLLEMLGSPERRFRSVHVAGTKGKGSTSAMVHAIAQECGLKAGLYTSPHLVDIRERIRVGRDEIAPGDLSRLIEAARPHVERLRRDGDPATFFEIFTAVALRHFAEAGVDLAVVEVGLGGRLDATNVLGPDVSVMTAISIDHVEQLGATLASIAAEKAGIVKPGVPVVSQSQPPEALKVIEGACRGAGAPLVLVGREVTYTWGPAERGGRRGIALEVRTPAATYDDLFVPLMGEHQAMNASAAIAAAQGASSLAGRLTPERVRKALSEVAWPGRMEYVPARPRRGAVADRVAPDMLLDGAHNRASMQRLAEALRRHFPDRALVVVFASAADKDIDGMLAVLADRMGGGPVVFTRTDNPRAADPADLASRFAAKGGAGGRTAADVPAALDLAAELSAPGGLIVACGSLYLVGEIKSRT
jgi:dihydrofolate synthase/folylpolyglutamate synthase